MQKIGIFYGSSTGNTEFTAQRIQKEIGLKNADLTDVSCATKDDLNKYKNLILGCSTWGSGDVQDDFDTFISEIDKTDFSGKVVALFALGDQHIYEYSFANSLAILYKKLIKKDCKIIGQWSVDGYCFKKSKAVINGSFAGLVIDEDNQSDLTDSRIKKWVKQIKNDFI